MKLRSFILKQFKKKVRVYILPTRMGGYLNGLIFLMFLLSVGYGNNLLLIFTLILFAFNLIWVIQTHSHLRALMPLNVFVQNGHAGMPLAVKVFWMSTPEGPTDFALSFESAEDSFPVSSYPQSPLGETDGHIVLHLRGIWNWEHLKVKSQMPFGLYRTWIYFPIHAKSFSYPKLSMVKAWEDPTLLHQDAETATFKIGSAEFSGLGPYREGDSRRISWKHYANSGNLIVKEGEELAAVQMNFKLSLPGPEDKEEYLSRLASQMVDCTQRQIPFTLEAGNIFHGPSFSANHLTDCLKVLCLC